MNQASIILVWQILTHHPFTKSKRLPLWQSNAIARLVGMGYSNSDNNVIMGIQLGVWTVSRIQPITVWEGNRLAYPAHAWTRHSFTIWQCWSVLSTAGWFLTRMGLPMECIISVTVFSGLHGTMPPNHVGRSAVLFRNLLLLLLAP